VTEAEEDAFRRTGSDPRRDLSQRSHFNHRPRFGWHLANILRRDVFTRSNFPTQPAVETGQPPAGNRNTPSALTVNNGSGLRVRPCFEVISHDCDPDSDRRWGDCVFAP
jgi:hypothetical protein